MSTLDSMSINEVIEFYHEKHHAIRDGNMIKLLELKNKCPELFDKEKAIEIRGLIEYIKIFQSSNRYKELCKLYLKSKLAIIKNDI